MRRWLWIPAATLSTAAILWAVTVNGSLEILGTLKAHVVDFSSSASTSPMKVGTTLPGSCMVGQAFFKSDATPGQNIYLCPASNTWTPIQGGGTNSGKPSAQVVSMTTEFSNTYNLGSPAYLGDFVFYRAAGSGALNYSGGGSDRIGVLRVQTSSTANDKQHWYAQFAAPGSVAQSLYANTTQEWELQCIWRYPATTDYADSKFYMGIHSTFSGEPARGFGVRYLAGTDTTFVFYADEAGGTWGNTLASGITPDANWHTLRIRSDGATAYKMWIRLDNDAERSICPSGCNITLPSGLADLFMKAFAVSITTTASAQKNIELDHLYFWMNGVTR